MCEFQSDEVSGSLRLKYLWVGANVDQLQSWQISNMFDF